jgi:5'-nucleotidase
MPYPIDKKLVVAVSSTALFDLTAEHDLYLELGVDRFREYQRERRSVIPRRGAAFPFIQRLLNLNAIYSEERPIEVVLLSRNHADAGLRVMDAVAHYNLEISRSFFLAGQLPYPYMRSLSAVLYLSTNKDEVVKAVSNGFAAGYVLPCETIPTDDEKQLRIAFDFDGVIASDESEVIYQDSGNLDLFYEHEKKLKDKPLQAGPLMPLLLKISEFQKLERQKAQNMDEYTQMLRIAIVTARNAPAHERLINALSGAGIDADELFLLGGIEKKLVLDVLRPHIFFDDQIGHLQPASVSTPSVHVPFGITNYTTNPATKR